MNLFLGITSLVLCTFLGAFYAKKYTNRKNFYMNFSSFNSKIKNEVAFTQNSIVSISKNISFETNDFNDCVKKVFCDNTPFEFDKKYITKDEIEYFSSYLKTIGTSDRETQIQYIESASKYLNEKLAKAEENEKKYKKAYVKLGFLIGLILLIVLL